MTIWVVRHGCAGNKDDWRGDDDERPLDPAGTAQAAALADLLATTTPRRLLSSPARRSLDTLQPLAARLDRPIDIDKQLCPQNGHGPLMEVLRDEQSDGVVVCSHGEAMRPLLAELRRRGLVVIDDEPEARLLLKGVAWELSRSSPVRLLLHAPVPVLDCPQHTHPEPKR